MEAGFDFVCDLSTATNRDKYLDMKKEKGSKVIDKAGINKAGLAQH